MTKPISTGQIIGLLVGIILIVFVIIGLYALNQSTESRSSASACLACPVLNSCDCTTHPPQICAASAPECHLTAIAWQADINDYCTKFCEDPSNFPTPIPTTSTNIGTTISPESGTVLSPTPISLTCDFNSDNLVDGLDYTVIWTNYQLSVPPGTQGDCNGDGIVNGLDYVKLHEEWQQP